jgi:hypothetical protein
VATGRQKRNKGQQRTTVLCVLGRVSLRRTWWHSPTSGSDAPLDAWIMADGSGVTCGVREMACRLNNDAASFAKAADNLARTAQIAMCAEQLRLLVEAEGRVVMEAQRVGAIPPAFAAPDCLVPDQPGRTRMYAGVDGVMVPLVTEAEQRKRREKVVQKRRVRESAGRTLKPLPQRRPGSDRPYKEFKTVTFYDQLNDHRHIVLSRTKRTGVGAVLKREAARLHFDQADERIGLVDGASWIPPQFEAAALRLDGLGLDYYHLSENVHRCRRATFGEECADGTAWADALLHTFKHEGYEAAREQLLAWRTSLRGQKRQAADRLLNYVIERRDMISDPQFATHGWHIGSGPTEARCKTSTSRLKRSGQRWTGPHAEAVATLTNLRDSNQWHRYWTNLPPAKT